MRALLPLLLGVAGLASAVADDGCQPATEAAHAALNALRSRAQQCGEHVWPAAPSLRPSSLLAESAQRYARELAARDRVDHIGAAGTSLRTRLRDAGYAMRVSGENLAGGPDTLDEALAQWMRSPAHCENLMLTDFQEFGLACVRGPGSYRRYWVLHLAAPLKSSPDRSP